MATSDKPKTPLIHIVLPSLSIVFVALGVVATTVGNERESGNLMLGIGVGLLFANGIAAYLSRREQRTAAPPSG